MKVKRKMEQLLRCSRCGIDKPLTEYTGKKSDRPPKEGDMCKQCRAQAQSEGRKRASEGRTYKTPETLRESQRQRMKAARSHDPNYGQPRVNRRTLAYCEHCHEVMPWGEATGSVKDKKDLTCPKCHKVLMTLSRAPPAGSLLLRGSVAFCIECLSEMYWQKADRKKKKGETYYACPDCGQPLYAIRRQLTGRRGGNMKQNENGNGNGKNTVQEELP
jgi:uncharacterized C2H2 Zn-finger protein